MALKKNIGKNTLGDGKKMQVDLRTYNRSTHDLSFAWRNTQGVGTLVPCFKQLALPGDTFDIDIDAKVMTHPTVGPLFGSYKLQVDFFVAPIRLYNAMLHNNALNIGLDMSKVKLPTISTRPTTYDTPDENEPWRQISPSCVLAYLGLRGYGIDKVVKWNATPLLAYLDIFKNYYANKQEENYHFLCGSPAPIITEKNTLSYIYSEIAGGTTFTGSITLTTDKGNVSNYNQWYYNFKGNHGSPDVSMNWTEMSESFKAAVEGTTITIDGKTTTTNLMYKGKLYNGALQSITASLPLEIKSAPLEELDTLRENILAAPSGTAYNPVTTECQYLYQLIQKNQRWVTSLDGAGLLLKTYQSDLFNNWINTEWVDGDNGISTITAISTAGDEFTIDSLNLAKKVYDMLNRIAVSGGSYRDWIETVYTSDYTIHAETPIYEGGMSDEIVFQEVVSNSATEEEPLGTLAGRGTLAGNRKGGKMHIKINEPSYIIGICSITPRVDYCQGNDWDMFLQTMNDLHKPQLDGIGYEDLLVERAAWWKQGSNESIGKTVAWINYMTNFNKTYGNFAKEDNEAFMVLNRYYDPEDGNYATGKVNTSSYINPQDFNYTFADTSLEAQNFWVQLGFGVKVRRVMSAKQIPNL